MPDYFYLEKNNWIEFAQTVYDGNRYKDWKQIHLVNGEFEYVEGEETNKKTLKIIEAEKVGTEVYIVKEFDFNFTNDKDRKCKIKQLDIDVEWKITIEEIKKPKWYTTTKVQELLKELRSISDDEELNRVLDQYITPF